MEIRLNRHISMCGEASRRKADTLIEAGRVKVNGVIVTEVGVKIDAEKDKVEVDGKLLKAEAKRYIVLNKPRYYLTTLGEDSTGKSTIVELIKNMPQRVYPVGRLDFDSEGLLILTNDGELANRIHHPSYGIEKVYRAIVRGRIEPKDVARMKRGAKLEDGFVKPDSVKVLSYGDGDTFITLAFHEGKNHLVKRFLTEFGFHVKKLRRIAVGPVRLGILPSGTWRDLTDKELSQLRRMTEK